MKLLKSIALIFGAMAVMVVVGLPAFFGFWAVVLGLYLYSRLSKSAALFANWSWFEFLVTISLGLGIPYVVLLVTAGF